MWHDEVYAVLAQLKSALEEPVPHVRSLCERAYRLAHSAPKGEHRLVKLLLTAANTVMEEEQWQELMAEESWELEHEAVQEMLDSRHR